MNDEHFFDLLYDAWAFVSEAKDLATDEIDKFILKQAQQMIVYIYTYRKVRSKEEDYDIPF